MVVSNNTEEKKIKEVELVFPEGGPKDSNNWIKKGPTGDILRGFSASIDDITKWFKQYQVDTIEVWISGIIETGEVLSLLVSAKGEGGLKVVLKPKN